MSDSGVGVDQGTKQRSILPILLSECGLLRGVWFWWCVCLPVRGYMQLAVAAVEFSPFARSSGSLNEFVTSVPLFPVWPGLLGSKKHTSMGPDAWDLPCLPPGNREPGPKTPAHLEHSLLGPTSNDSTTLSLTLTSSVCSLMSSLLWSQLNTLITLPYPTIYCVVLHPHAHTD